MSTKLEEISLGNTTTMSENVSVVQCEQTLENFVRSKSLRNLFVIAQIVILTSISLIIAWCVVFDHGFQLSGHSLFYWHPLFMAGGLIFSSGNAIICFRVFRHKKRIKVKLTHALLNAFGILHSIFGVYAVKSFLDFEGAPHLFTLHSWVGATTLTIYFAQAVLGFYMFLTDCPTNSMKSAFKKYHVTIGNVVFFMAIACALIGFNEKAIWSLGNAYKQRVPAAWVINSAGLLLVIFGIMIYFISSGNIYHLKKH